MKFRFGTLFCARNNLFTATQDVKADFNSVNFVFKAVLLKAFCFKRMKINVDFIHTRKLKSGSKISLIIATNTNLKELAFGNCHKLKKIKYKISITYDLNKE